MIAEALDAVPQWLLVGLGLGLASSLAAAGLFVLAARRYPSPANRAGRRSGESRRRAELREYLDAVGEQYAEDHPVAGQQVAFYLPERDVAVTFDARAYYRIERGGTRAVLVEHEMPGPQLGDRLPFDTPEVSFGDPSAERPDPTAAALAELGVPTDADPAAVKAAYRRRVKEVHPDHGGDEDEFKRVREAYTTARKGAG